MHGSWQARTSDGPVTESSPLPLEQLAQHEQQVPVEVALTRELRLGLNRSSRRTRRLTVTKEDRRPAGAT